MRCGCGCDRLGTTWYIEIVIDCYRSGWLASHVSGQCVCLVSKVSCSGVPTAGNRGEPHAVLSPSVLIYKSLLRWGAINDQGAACRAKASAPQGAQVGFKAGGKMKTFPTAEKALGLITHTHILES